jgi:adenylate kinase
VRDVRDPAASAVLVTGVYGAGKSTLVADLGALLGEHGVTYGLLDVDFLGWFDVGQDAAEQRHVVLDNVRHLAASFLDRGATRLLVAWSVGDAEQLGQLRAAVGVPVRVVRLEVPESLVTARLAADPTAERSVDDLRVARDWLASGRGVGLEDLTLPGDRPVRETSRAVCAWLGWL